METFNKLFGSLLAFVYHCFDRIVIQGYLPLLTREEHIVHFFRDILGLYPITKDVLSRRTTEYKHWVEAFARNHKILMEWAQKGVRKEDYVRPHLERMQRRNRCEFGCQAIGRRATHLAGTWTRDPRSLRRLFLGDSRAGSHRGP